MNWFYDLFISEAKSSLSNHCGSSSNDIGSGTSEEWIGDGNTHIWITLPEGRTSPMLCVCPNGTATVDWGDGSEPDVLTGTDVSTYGVQCTPIHNYAKSGDYVITLTVDGEIGLYGSSSSNEYSGILRYSLGSDTRNRVYQNAVKRVELGDGATNIGNYAFAYCFSLVSVTIPDSVTTIGSSAFTNCYSLVSITIPDSVTTISSGAFSNCFSLVSVTIPDSVTTIGSSAFTNCCAACYFDFTNHITVPTLSHTNAFSSIAPDCEIRVPAALYEQWKAATNWATYASKIVAV